LRSAMPDRLRGRAGVHRFLRLLSSERTQG
jgi:hypothetical protein